MTSLASSIDSVRASLAVLQVQAGLSSADVRDVALVRGALQFYRQQVCPGVPAQCGCSSGLSARSMLEQIELALQKLAASEENTLPQRKMLRGCLEKVRGVRARMGKQANTYTAAFDWRAAQLPRGDAA